MKPDPAIRLVAFVCDTPTVQAKGERIIVVYKRSGPFLCCWTGRHGAAGSRRKGRTNLISQSPSATSDTSTRTR